MSRPKSGRPAAPLYTTVVIDTFWSMVDRRGPEECWPWLGARYKRGYGAFHIPGFGERRANRVALELSTGQMLVGRQRSLHSCDCPPCCNPDHLWCGTDDDNVRDRTKKQRDARGVRVNTNKLTPIQVIEVKSTTGDQRKLAARLGVCKSTIGAIRRGEIWKWLARDEARKEMGVPTE